MKDTKRSVDLVAMDKAIEIAEAITTGKEVINIDDINIEIAPLSGNTCRIYCAHCEHDNAWEWNVTRGCPSNADKSKIRVTFNSGDASRNIINAIKWAFEIKSKGGRNIKIYPYN